MNVRALLGPLAAATLALAAGCGGDEHSDLREELNQLTKDMRGRVDPLPQVRPYEPVPYTAETQVDPFRPERPEEVEQIVDAALFDGEFAVHVGFAERQPRTNCEANARPPIMDPHGHGRSWPVPATVGNTHSFAPTSSSLREMLFHNGTR